ncbi:MAG: trypsin-like peptidase domain-containing protein, partial [Clostridia bacterium]|nr:trypsin-like peptidase domain-containing protein [Clostridia bacterium]
EPPVETPTPVNEPAAENPCGDATEPSEVLTETPSEISAEVPAEPTESENPIAPAEIQPEPSEPAEVQPEPVEPVEVPTVDAENDLPKEKPRKNGIWLVIGIIAVSISLLIGAFAIWAAGNNDDALTFPQDGEGLQIPQSNTPSFNFRDDVTEEDKLTPQEIIAKVSPSVVVVSVEGSGVAGFGTGFIYTDNGYILTNAHVVDDATRITVTDYYGKTYAATLIGADSQSDVAVIKINATGLKAVEFGQSSAVVPGDTVIAIGTPYAEELSFTATQGMVSAIREGLNFPKLGYTLDLIQHDAPINSGNSGGPLINVYGQVIGINSIKITGSYENLGFALQIDDVLPLAEEMMNNGKVSRPGIGIKAHSNVVREEGGVEISEIVPQGAAEKAGLKKGDIIMKIDDVDVTNFATMKKAIQSKKIGDTVTVTYIRDGQEYTASLVLGALEN